MLWSVYVLVLATIVLSNFAKAENITPEHTTQHGLTVFYKIEPTGDQVASYSVGEFGGVVPRNPYECPPDPDYLYFEPGFGCNNTNLKDATPIDIFNYRKSNIDCLSSGIAFERFQWATWIHACWQHPQPAIDTPDGHTEAAFQSNAMAFRQLVLYQHDMHMLTLNRQILAVRTPAEADQAAARDLRDKRRKEIDDWADEEIGKLPKHGGDHRNHWKEIEAQRTEKKKSVDDEWGAAKDQRERQFWKDSWESRLKVVELDHLIEDYFKRWMSGQTQGGWDWAGMGEPVPAWPPNGGQKVKR